MSRARQAARDATEGMFARAGHRLSSGQFGADAKQAMATGLELADRARYFRTAGLGAALRYAIGTPQMSPTMAHFYRSEALRNIGTFHVTGRNPGYFVAGW
jgi:hypothetical protein